MAMLGDWPQEDDDENGWGEFLAGREGSNVSAVSVPQTVLDLLSFDDMVTFLESVGAKKYLTSATIRTVLRGVLSLLGSKSSFLLSTGTGTGKTAMGMLMCVMAGLILKQTQTCMQRRDEISGDTIGNITREIEPGKKFAFRSCDPIRQRTKTTTSKRPARQDAEEDFAEEDVVEEGDEDRYLYYDVMDDLDDDSDDDELVHEV